MTQPKLDHISNLRCLICNKEYSQDQVEYVCPDHGTEGVLDVQYDYHAVKKSFSKELLSESRDFSIWRYMPLLPIQPDAYTSPLPVGWTPLLETPGIAQKLGIKKVLIKDDGRQPTASLKDRASAVAILKAREKEIPIITTASTGNAAAALSGLCAALNQVNVIFVPEDAPLAKIAQLLVFGSRVLLVKGTYDDAFELCMAAAREYGWYNRNTGFNPFMTEGKKTVILEICEQLDWQVPDRIFVSVGDGSIIGGIHKGLKDLKSLGWIDRIPKLMGVQARGSSYLYQAWKNHEDVLTKPAVKAQTIADSISAGLPRDRIKALRAVEETEGAYICVSDEKILDAVTELARSCGIFAEPAGAAAYAGLLEAVDKNQISPGESVVVINSGNGLKDIAGAMKAIEQVGTQPYHVAPDLNSLNETMRLWK